MPRSHRFGADCKVLVRTSGTWASPVRTELKTVGDCTLSPTWEKQSLKLRLARMNFDVKTIKDLSVTGKVLDDGSAVFETLDAAAAGDDTVDLLVLNGPPDKPKTRGYRFHAQVTKWDESQNPGDVLMRDFEFKPTIPDVLTELPQRVVVDGTGALVLTDAAPTEVEEEA